MNTAKQPAEIYVSKTSCVAQELASAGRFGRALPPAEQAFLLLTDSVAKQLDALKNDASLSQPVRRFLGKGLDACGPAGWDPTSG